MDIAEADEDIISSFPEYLLIHILSFLGDTKEIVKTCVLSKKWQFVWTKLLEVDLKESMFANDLEPLEIVKYADRMISKCNNLNRLAIELHYDTAYISDINNLINKIVNKNTVKDFSLSLDSDADIEDDENKYHLPQELFSYSSLTKLSVSFCAIDPPLGIIEWKCLESLKITCMNLSSSVMANILSNCPLLKILDIRNCWGLSNLDIKSPNLTTLYYGSQDDVDDVNVDDVNIDDVSQELVVSAPYLRVLWIFRECGGKKYTLQNVSSVVEATIEFDNSSENWSSSEESTISNMINFLQGLQSVEILELGSTALEIISELELNNLFDFPSFTKLLSLTLKVNRDEKSIPGILAMLRSSPKLRTLHIEGCEGYMDVDTPLPIVYMDKDTDCFIYGDRCMSPVKSNLKTVEIDNDIDTDHMMLLVQILLNCAIDLERMVINLDADLDSTEISKQLDAFPRESPKAVLELCYY